MSNAAESIRKLRAIAADLVAQRHPLAPWFAAALAEFEASAPQGRELGDAFGLGVTPGAVPWWQLERRQRRDELLREIASQHFPGLRGRAVASAIAERIERYQSSAWLRDRRLMSPASTEPLRLRLHRLLKLNQALGLSTIRRALCSGSNGSPSFEPRRLRRFGTKETNRVCELP